jgi:hypothetical protein
MSDTIIDCGKYENVPISEQTEKEMHLTSSDRQYLQRMFCLQDENTAEFIKKEYDIHAKLIIGAVRDIIAENNKLIFDKIDEQWTVIKAVQKLQVKLQSEIKDHEKRIKALELALKGFLKV